MRRGGFGKIIMEQNRICALVPARSGSKGLVNKNKISFAGSNLTNIALANACASRLITDVALSTDDYEIFDSASHLPLITNPIRPSFLSTDESSIVDVALDFLNTQKDLFGKSWDYLILLEPTAPLRTVELLDIGISQFLQSTSDYDACVTVGELNFGLDSLFHLQGKKLVSLDKDADPRKRRQQQESIYFPFGIFYLIKVETLTKFRTFYPKNVLGYIIPQEVCIEVDSLFEFQIAEFIYKNRGL
jgi:CMP-N,N'-diacetyllegionaminic acid synthase